MIRWISKLPFFKEIYRLGGIDSFPLAQKDVLETMRDDLDKQAEELAKKKLNDLLSPVDLQNIITLNKQGGIIYIGGEKADDALLGNLKSEAEYLVQTRLWKLLIETPKSLAEREIFTTGENLDAIKKGRSILYTLSSQKNIIDLLKSYQPKK